MASNYDKYAKCINEPDKRSHRASRTPIFAVTRESRPSSRRSSPSLTSHRTAIPNKSPSPSWRAHTVLKSRGSSPSLVVRSHDSGLFSVDADSYKNINKTVERFGELALSDGSRVPQASTARDVTTAEDYIDHNGRIIGAGYDNYIDRKYPGSREEAYSTYPVSQPFIHDDYRRDANRPIIAYPESNRQAVMSALKNLQTKIHQLEIERNPPLTTPPPSSAHYTQREDAMFSSTGSVPTFTSAPSSSRYATKSVSTRDVSVATSERQTDETLVTDVFGKLETAEQRCELLDKQLEYMRQLVKQAELDRGRAIDKSSKLQEEARGHERGSTQPAARRLSVGFEDAEKKIRELEREQLHLTATQALAENKIRELHDELAEERRRRNVTQRKAASAFSKSKLEADQKIDRLHRGKETGRASPGEKNPKRQPVTKKKRRGGVSMASSALGVRINRGVGRKYPAPGGDVRQGRKISGTEPTEHYKLKLSEIPFIIGKSTGPSYSLNANFQAVLSLMKAHNPRLCRTPRVSVTEGDATAPVATDKRRKERVDPDVNFRGSFDDGSSTQNKRETWGEERKAGLDEELVIEEELQNVLLQLQDEFAHMSFEHEELIQRIERITIEGDVTRGGDHIQNELRAEFDSLVLRLKTKADQITLLRKYQHAMSSKRQTKQEARGSNNPPPPIPVTSVSSDAVSLNLRRVRSSTVTKLDCPSTSGTPTSGHHHHHAQSSLDLLKDLRKIQTTLRCDDLSWGE